MINAGGEGSPDYSADSNVLFALGSELVALLFEASGLFINNATKV